MKFLENIYEAERIIRKIDHILYITYPIVKDKRLLLKTLVDTKIAITKLINFILQYEYLYKRIRLYKTPKENLRIFHEKCAPKYKITKQELKLISNLFYIVQKHKESPFEFRKKDKIVILSETSSSQIIVLENNKEFLEVAKQILQKTKQILSN